MTIFHTMQASLPSLEIEHRQAQSSNPPQTQQGAPGATLRIVQRNQAMATKALLLWKPRSTDFDRLDFSFSPFVFPIASSALVQHTATIHGFGSVSRAKHVAICTTIWPAKHCSAQRLS